MPYASTSTQLIPYTTLYSFCNAYQASVTETRQAFELLTAAKRRMEPLISYFRIADRSSNDFPDVLASAEDRMRRCAWREIIIRTGVRDAMTQQRRKLLDEQLERGELPPVEVERVYGFLEGLRLDLPLIIAESITAAAKILRPHDQQFKTNGDGWQLGMKAITEYGVNYRFGSMGLNYSREGDIAAVDAAFHLLDGKGPPQRPHDLLTAIRAAMSTNLQECTTVYFRVKWFKKGTIHWEFRRADLVAELNVRAADHRTMRAG